MTANTFVQGQRVKGQGHSVCKRQRRLTVKSVRICCLFNVEKGCGATCSTFVVARWNFPKCNIFEQKKTENADNMPDRLARSRSGL